MTLSDAEVIKQLNQNFVSGWKNIKGKTAYAGSSNTHLPSYPAKRVSNCAGHHNVQMIFMTADGRVIHCLPGFWNKTDFLHELDLAAKVGTLYHQQGISAVKRNAAYLDLHLNHALNHSPSLRMSSKLTNFDKKNLEKRTKTDFKREEGFISYGLKTPDQVLHERLAERPFISFESFDVKQFIDMGTKKYKYDYGVPGKGGGT